MKNYYLAVVLDIVLVIVFAAIGTYTHHHLITAALLARVAWPFLVALLVGHLAIQAWKVSPFRLWPHGVFITAITVVGAMLIRVLIGDGTATAFIIVAFVVNSIFLLGWRTIATLVNRARARRAKNHLLEV